MSAAEIALEPCPFCGGEAVYCPDTSYGQERVFCPDRNECNASPWTYGEPNSGEAIAAWNRRHD